MNRRSALLIFCILFVTNLVTNVLSKRSHAYNFEVVDDDEFAVDSVDDNNENRGKGSKYQRLSNGGDYGQTERDGHRNKRPDRIKGITRNDSKYDQNLERILRLIRKNSFENENKFGDNSKSRRRSNGYGSYG